MKQYTLLHTTDRDALILGNLSIVVPIARKIARSMPNRSVFHRLSPVEGRMRRRIAAVSDAIRKMRHRRYPHSAAQQSITI
jgi:hypothetical protein